MGYQIQLFLVLLLVGLVSSTYDPNYGQIFSEYSLVSYCNDNKKNDWSCGAPCNRVQRLQNVHILKGDLQAEGYVGYRASENAIVLVFRGTVPWQITNWISDIDTIKTKYPHCGNNCEVHEGFFRAFNILKDQMISALRDLRNQHPGAQMYISGHSLGAAMATFAVPAVYLEFGIKTDKFYTIGSPRVGDLNFSNWWKVSQLAIEEARITHQCDPVPHLPPENFGFIHIPHEIFYQSFKGVTKFHFIKKDAKYTVCDDPEDKRCANSCIIPGDVLDHNDYFDLDFTLQIPICYL